MWSSYATPNSRRFVAAFIATAFAQNNAAAANTKWREVAEHWRPDLSKLAGFVDQAEQDVLVYMSFPVDHWPKICPTNVLERLNGKIKQRAHVVGVFPTRTQLSGSSARSCSNRTTNGPFNDPATSHWKPSPL
jgi:transposase-like protein